MRLLALQLKRLAGRERVIRGRQAIECEPGEHGRPICAFSPHRASRYGGLCGRGRHDNRLLDIDLTGTR